MNASYVGLLADGVEVIHRAVFESLLGEAMLHCMTYSVHTIPSSTAFRSLSPRADTGGTRNILWEAGEYSCSWSYSDALGSIGTHEPAHQIHGERP